MSTHTEPDPGGDGEGYVLGDVHANTSRVARFETKKTAEYPGGRTGSGGGYERWRSYEYRPHTPREGKEDVYVPVHRLLYLTHPSLMEIPIGDALEELDGCDVHHRNGIRWDNRIGNLELLDHAKHSELTQARMRAFGEDAKQSAQDPAPVDDRCPGCGRDDVELPARSEGFDGARCIRCAKAESDGHPIHLD